MRFATQARRASEWFDRELDNVIAFGLRLERLYLLVDGRTARDGQLEENGLFVFATDGGGSFFVFNVKRSFHHVDMAGWCSPSEYWDDSFLNSWSDAREFCDWFNQEYKLQNPD